MHNKLSGLHVADERPNGVDDGCELRFVDEEVLSYRAKGPTSLDVRSWKTIHNPQAGD